MVRLKRFTQKSKRRGVNKVKSESKIITILLACLVGTIVIGMTIQSDMEHSKTVAMENKARQTTKESNHIKDEEEKEEKEISEKEEPVKVAEVVVAEPTPTPTPLPTPTPDPIVYDGLTMNQLADKLNRSLGSDLSGTGYTFASKSLALGIDPYMAVAIVLHETGCQWDCSYLVKACNNVGGMKGIPGCGGGAYASFSTLDQGIESYLNNLYKNYYTYGLTTPETIGPKYAASTSWSSKVNWYINAIREK